MDNFNSRKYTKEVKVTDRLNLRVRPMLKMAGTGNSVLDLACNEGTISTLIKNSGNLVTGVEISDYGVRESRKKGFKVYKLDLNTPDWSKKIKSKFDVVFAGEIIEHIFETDTFLTNIYNVLKKGGYLVLSTPNLASFGRRLLLLLGKDPVTEHTSRNYEAGHLRYYVFQTLSNVLADNNFRIVECTSDVVNFSHSGKINSILLAKMFPSIGASLIIKAIKSKL